MARGRDVGRLGGCGSTLWVVASRNPGEDWSTHPDPYPADRPDEAIEDARREMLNAGADPEGLEWIAFQAPRTGRKQK